MEKDEPKCVVPECPNLVDEFGLHFILEVYICPLHEGDLRDHYWPEELMNERD